MENSDFEAVTANAWVNPDKVFEATCKDCSTPARFESSYDYAIGDTFGHHCYSCGSGQFPGLGSTTQFQVTDLSPDLETPPVSVNPPPIYSSDNAD
jgi:hypothetical protein